MHARLLAIPNVRFRDDGRYEWRKTINKIDHQVIDPDPFEFNRKYQQYQRELKKFGNEAKKVKPKLKHILIDLLWAYHKRYRVEKIKPKSLEVHEIVMRCHLNGLTKDINEYSKNDIQDFLNSIPQTRTAQICYGDLKVVFADAYADGITKRNVMATLEKPAHDIDKGSWLVPADQQKLMDNLPKGIFGKEILFYILTSARCSEAKTATIDFEKRIVIIKRPKTEKSGIAETIMPLSQKFCDMIKDDWQNMFKAKTKWQGIKIARFLESIGIKGKTAHDLRHTFSTNIYYLGVDPKRHQYLMGYTTLKMSYDVYTSLVPYIKKQDIVNIYGDLYPEF